MNPQPRLYADLADWWYLLSPVEEYEEEAAIFTRTMRAHARGPLRDLLELGSGGGNNAWHMKSTCALTLVDLSEGMVAQSRRVNPECDHHVGDMRSVRLGRTFDAVFIHDAIDYMTTADDLRRAIETARVHCRSGGVVLLVPDHVRETFAPSTDHGGTDGPDRALRYLEWTWDPDPSDTVCVTDYCYALRRSDGSLQVEHDRHLHGLFPRQQWIETMESLGLATAAVPFEHSQLDPGASELFVGVAR